MLGRSPGTYHPHSFHCRSVLKCQEAYSMLSSSAEIPPGMIKVISMQFPCQDSMYVSSRRIRELYLHVIRPHVHLGIVG